MKLPISACLIVKNDENILEKCLLSIRDYVEEIVVVDTGSTDKSPEIAQKYADIFEVYTDCNDPETGLINNFAQARARSFALSTKPYVLWIDSDDIVVGMDKLANLLEQHRLEDYGTDSICFMFPYEYSFNDKGECVCVHYRERLIYNKSLYTWVNPVHEVLIHNNGVRVQFIQSDEIIYKHQRQYFNKPAETGRNLRIIEKYSKEHPEDARQLYYLGLELFNVQRFDESHAALEKYISMSGWDDEKCMACLKLIDICFLKNNFNDGLKWGFKALENKENWSECYFALAKMFYFIAQQGGPEEMRNWQKVVYFAKLGLSLPPTTTVLFINPQERTYIIHQYLNVALSKIGDLHGALNSTNAALQVYPNDSNLLYNKKIYETIIYTNETLAQIDKLQNTGVISNEIAKSMRELLRNPNGGNTVILDHKMSRNGVFPAAHETNNPKNWMVPTTWEMESYPIEFSDQQLQALVLAIWKQYMLHDEVLAAITFLNNAPYRVKHTFATQKALEMTKATIAWMDNKELLQKHNSPINTEVESGRPLPLLLSEGSQEKQRFDLILNNLGTGSKFVLDFGCFDGCFTNRYGLLGHKVVGLDLSETSIKLANNKAKEFNTGAEHILTKFENSVANVSYRNFDYATSSDTYEHLKDPVNEMLLPAKEMLKDDGKFLLVTPHGAWMRGQYLSWAHPWLWEKENGSSWLAPNPKGHIVAPTVWSVAEHFKQAGYWVKNSYAVLCDNSNDDLSRDIKDQGNIFVEACKQGPTTDKKLDIVFFVGNGLEEWTPKSVEKTGVGGSEIAVIFAAKLLALKGHIVRVYNNCATNGEGIYDGVEYYNFDKFQDLTCDVLIVSRVANMLDDVYNIQAKLRILWCHDICAVNGKHHLLLKADRIFALSNWHKEYLCDFHNLHKEHVIVTRNGIDLKRFDKEVERDPYRCFNSSSPDRSYHQLLTYWSEIRNHFDEPIKSKLSLHLYYGFKNWNVLASRNPQAAAEILALKQRIESMKDQNVFFHDRVSQEALAEEMLKSSLHLYPTNFTETSCISAMESQAAGCKIITSALAALNETVAHRGILIHGDCNSETYKKKFIEETVKALTKGISKKERNKLQNYAIDNFAWNSLIDEWENMFYDLIEEVKKHPISSYEPTENYKK